MVLAFLRPYFYPALVVCVLCAASFVIGRQRGAGVEAVACADARAEAERAVAQSLADLARRQSQADAEAAKRRAEAQRLAHQVKELRNEALAALPAADCRVDGPRRMLIHDAYCARYPTSPACVSGALPGVPEPATAD